MLRLNVMIFNIWMVAMMKLCTNADTTSIVRGEEELLGLVAISVCMTMELQTRQFVSVVGRRSGLAELASNNTQRTKKKVAGGADVCGGESSCRCIRLTVVRMAVGRPQRSAVGGGCGRFLICCVFFQYDFFQFF